MWKHPNLKGEDTMRKAMTRNHAIAGAAAALLALLLALTASAAGSDAKENALPAWTQGPELFVMESEGKPYYYAVGQDRNVEVAGDMECAPHDCGRIAAREWAKKILEQHTGCTLYQQDYEAVDYHIGTDRTWALLRIEAPSDVRPTVPENYLEQTVALEKPEWVASSKKLYTKELLGSKYVYAVASADIDPESADSVFEARVWAQSKGVFRLGECIQKNPPASTIKLREYRTDNKVWFLLRAPSPHPYQ